MSKNIPLEAAVTAARKNKSDLIILVGYDPIEMRSSWTSPWRSNKKVIEFSATSNTHYAHQATFSFIGDACSGLKKLTHNVKPKPIWKNNRQKKVRALIKSAFLSEKK